MTEAQTVTTVERAVAFDICELRAQTEGDGLTLTGYAATFDTPTRIDSWEGKFDEQIASGAFRKTIRERTPLMMWNHGNDPTVGQVPIGVIHRIGEDRKGLYLEARLHDNESVKPVRDAIASGAVQGMSIRMQVIKDAWDESGDVPSRTIHEVRLLEAGPVAFPAYLQTSVGVRADQATAQAAAEALGLAGPEEPEPDPTVGWSQRFLLRLEPFRS